MAGIMNKVKKVEEVSPPIIVRAIGILNSAPSAVLRAIGNIPMIVVKVVISTGLNLSEPA